ncbi:MAG: sugar phosphate isomerase/epimerase family protein [Candidatus Hydrogenedentota bacterium]
MTEHWSNYLRAGIVHFMAYPECMDGEGPVAETVERIVQDEFFEVIEITQVKDDNTRTTLRDLFEQSGITACFGAQPYLLKGGYDLNHAELETRGKAVADVKRGIDQAAAMGCASASVVSGPVANDKSEARERLAEALTELAAYAQVKGLTLSLETFDQAAFGKNRLVGPTEDAVAVSEMVRQEQPSFGLLLDLSHLPLLGETPEHAASTAAEHLVHAHIGNCAMDDPEHPAFGDTHPRFGMEGTRVGVNELAAFLRQLLEVNYLSKARRGIVSFEVKPMAGESSEAVIAGCKRALNEAWRLV